MYRVNTSPLLLCLWRHNPQRKPSQTRADTFANSSAILINGYNFLRQKENALYLNIDQLVELLSRFFLQTVA